MKDKKKIKLIEFAFVFPYRSDNSAFYVDP